MSSNSDDDYEPTSRSRMKSQTKPLSMMVLPQCDMKTGRIKRIARLKSHVTSLTTADNFQFNNSSLFDHATSFKTTLPYVEVGNSFNVTDHSITESDVVEGTPLNDTFSLVSPNQIGNLDIPTSEIEPSHEVVDFLKKNTQLLEKELSVQEQLDKAKDAKILHLQSMLEEQQLITIAFMRNANVAQSIANSRLLIIADFGRKEMELFLQCQFLGNELSQTTKALEEAQLRIKLLEGLTETHTISPSPKDLAHTHIPVKDNIGSV